jgi:hypothetical protein
MFASIGARGGLIAGVAFVVLMVAGGIWVWKSEGQGSQPPRNATMVAPAPSTPPAPSGARAMITGDAPLNGRRPRDLSGLLTPDKPENIAGSILDTKGPAVIETSTPDFGAPLQSSLPPAAR